MRFILLWYSMRMYGNETDENLKTEKDSNQNNYKKFNVSVAIPHFIAKDFKYIKKLKACITI